MEYASVSSLNYSTAAVFTTQFLFTFAAISLGQPQPTIVSGNYRSPGLLIAPGQVIPLTVYGLSTPVRDTVAETLPLPKRLAGFEIKLRQREFEPVSLPIFSVLGRSSCLPFFTPCESEPMAIITAQIPYSLLVPSPADSMFGRCCDGVLTIYENGVKRGDTRVSPVFDQIRLISGCDTELPFSSRVAFGRFGDSCGAPVFNSQGQQLDQASLANSGDVLTVYAWGLGAVAAFDSIVEGEAPRQALPVARSLGVRYQFAADTMVGRDPPPHGLATEGYLWARLIPGSVGLYQINLRVPPIPAGTPACGTPTHANSNEVVSSNLTITIRGFESFDGVRLYVAP